MDSTKVNLSTPEISSGLLAYLDKLYPASAWKDAQTFERIQFIKGQQALIDHLRSLHDHQQ